MKSIRSRKKSLQKAYKAEKKASVRIRILFVMYVWTDGLNPSEAARRLKMFRAWGPKWAKRYGERGPGRAPGPARKRQAARGASGHNGVVRRMAQDATCRAADGMHKHVLKNTGVDYSASRVRKIMKKWGYAMKAPAGRHAGRAGKGAHTPVPEEGKGT